MPIFHNSKSQDKKIKGKKKETGLNIQFKKTPKTFGDWYTDVIIKSEMISYYTISGCYILRPHSYKIWEGIQQWFDREIKKMGVENTYFPLFVAKSALEKEEDHLEGFVAEVAWVTKSGTSELAEPIAIRPTSETVMYPIFKDWIRSYRDLPLKLNQWTNVVRWEFKHPTPFIRTREFLWQEGHTAHATKDEADTEVLQILDLYARVYEELLAVPVIKGRKSEKEKFAGGLYTTTVEAFVPCAGRAIQGATSHCLGQSFAKMFDIKFETETGGDRDLVWQNSWGLTTRTIGVMIMVHGDDNGLVLPPKVAPIQVVIIMIQKASTTPEMISAMKERCNTIFWQLKKAGIRVKFDDRDDKNPGWKYSHWEQKGVCIRIEIGQRDMESGSVLLARRDLGKTGKSTCAWEDTLPTVQGLLETIQHDMLENARKERDDRISVVTEWKDFVPALDKMHMIIAPWCERTVCEEMVKERTGPTAEERAKDAAATGDEEEADKKLSGSAKTLCIPFEQEPLPEGTKCFCCGEPAVVNCLWGRSY
jgi:prolyl-tRNA synthetase